MHGFQYKSTTQYTEGTVGPLGCSTCPPIFMQLTAHSNGGTVKSAFLLIRKCNWLARASIMNVRNVTCVGTQTSKVPTRVAH